MKTNVKFSPVNISQRQKLDMRAGDTARVTVRIPEKDKVRLQAFEGLVLARKHGTEPGATFTVRKTASGVGVERTFPLYSPSIEKIEIVKHTKARRSKLYYIRDKATREIRRKMRNERTAMVVEDEVEEEVAEATEAVSENEADKGETAEETTVETAGTETETEAEQKEEAEKPEEEKSETVEAEGDEKKEQVKKED